MSKEHKSKYITEKEFEDYKKMINKKLEISKVNEPVINEPVINEPVVSKKPLTNYNIFMKEQMTKFKGENSKEALKKIAELWNKREVL